ncbi:MAG: S9 family peptidase [Acidobacteria bacterium]|nr:S9 family peptidase [Acidobacteriota bacterium]
MRKLALLFLPTLLLAQGTLADYQRYLTFSERNREALGSATPIHKLPRYWYRQAGTFYVIDAATAKSTPAFDHTKLAAALSKATNTDIKPDRVPFPTINFTSDNTSVEVVANQARYRIHLETYNVQKLNAVPRYPVALAGPTIQGLATPLKSPDNKFEAFIRNHNVWLKQPGQADTPLSFDGSEGNPYRITFAAWSPDSTKLVAYRLRLGQHRQLTYIESSPTDQVQPKYKQVEYAKPGDTLDIPQPVLFDAINRKQHSIDNTLFANPYFIRNLQWRKDSRAFTFEYNQRGHQTYRLIEVNASTAKPRLLIDEQSNTFFCYYSKYFLHHVDDGNEHIWMSERDGFNHLYLYDGKTGQPRQQITKGNWVVREVAKVDDKTRTIWFAASGMHPGKDPYYLHWFRINFDGTNLTPITNNPDLNHSLALADDTQSFVDTTSSPTTPPVMTLYKGKDQFTIATQTAPKDFTAPEPFTAKGRDNATDIWGLIFRPSNFNPNIKYPILEYIYAGPHDSFVPKTFSAASPMQAMAELGFIVVQMDGMGTSNRSKAFHDVAWRNIADAGFPDRILWHKAVAAKYNYYDLTRIGIYGHSAGGQNSLGALLFHPDFYKAAVSSAGCHDNRMDKISWNEQWMGWPVGPEYTASSNVEHAHKLKGKLLLAVGELDTNVDPASTMQVVNALIKANKIFDLLFLPGQNHGGWGDYWDRKRADFFVRELLAITPPDWNQLNPTPPSSAP